jgi:hypothetical protein
VVGKRPKWISMVAASVVINKISENAMYENYSNWLKIFELVVNSSGYMFVLKNIYQDSEISTLKAFVKYAVQCKIKWIYRWLYIGTGRFGMYRWSRG